MLKFDDITEYLPQDSSNPNSVVMDDLNSFKAPIAALNDSVAQISEFNQDYLESFEQAEQVKTSAQAQINSITKSLQDIAATPPPAVNVTVNPVIQPNQIDNVNTTNSSNVTNNSSNQNVNNNSNFGDTLESIENSVNTLVTNNESNIENNEAITNQSRRNSNQFNNSVDSILNTSAEKTINSNFNSNDSYDQDVRNMFASFVSSNPQSISNRNDSNSNVSVNSSQLDNTVNEITNKEEAQIDRSVMNNLVSSPASQNASALKELSTTITNTLSTVLNQNNERLVQTIAPASVERTSKVISDNKKSETNAPGSVQNSGEVVDSSAQLLMISQQLMKIAGILSGTLKVKQDKW